MVVVCPDMVVSKVCEVASSIARFLYFRVDEKKGVGTNIVESSRKAESMSEEKLGIGRGCVSAEWDVKSLKPCRPLMKYRSSCRP